MIFILHLHQSNFIGNSQDISECVWKLLTEDYHLIPPSNEMGYNADFSTEDVDYEQYT